MKIDNPTYKKNREFLDKVYELKRAKYSEEEVTRLMGLDNTMELRKRVSQANLENRQILVEIAKEKKEARKSVREIAMELGRNESTVRLLLDDEVNTTMEELRA